MRRRRWAAGLSGVWALDRESTHTLMSGRRKLGKLPRRRAAIQLSERDRFVCLALAKTRVMLTSDVALLAFPSLAIARRRLRRLHDGAVIAGYVEAYSTENRWVLDRRGRELLGLSATPAPSRPPAISVHRQLVVRLWVLLVRACHAEPTAELVRFRFEWELTGGELPTARNYRPDAVLALQVEGQLVPLLVEVDTGTEGLRHLSEVKFPRIVTARLSGQVIGGVPAEAVLLVTPSQRRLASLLSIAAEAGLSAVGLLLTPGMVSLSLADGWHRPGGVVGPLALPGLTSGTSGVSHVS